MDVLETIKKLVHQEMETEGRSQQYIGKRCGYDAIKFSGMLCGYRPIRAEDIEKIAIGLGVDPNFLYQWDERFPREEAAQ